MGRQQDFANKLLDKAKLAYPDLDLFSPIRIIKRKEFLVNAGQIDPHIYLVESGSLRVYHTTADEEITVRFGYTGSLLAVLPTLFTGEPTPYYIQAIKESRIRPIHKAKFHDLLERDNSIQEMWMTSLQFLVLDQLDREIDLLTNSPKERFERVWKRSPRLFQEIPNKYIASYLRMTPETLSRLKKSFFPAKS